jgi:hypothetical protein
MRSDDQTVDLLVAIVGKREYSPICAGLAGAYLDAADDAVGAGRGRYLDAIAVGVLELDGIGEVDGRGVEPDVDGLHRNGAGDAEQGCKSKGRERQGGAKKYQETTSEQASRRNARLDNEGIPRFTT